MANPAVDSTRRTAHVPLVTITIPERKLTRILYAIAILLVVAHMAVSINRYVLHWQFFGADNLYVLFDMWSEASIPTWYSSALLLVGSAVVAAIAAGKWRQHDRYRIHWAALAVLFLGMSLDDGADVHGQLSYKIHEVLGLGGYLTYAWVLPASVLVVLAGLFFLRFVLHLPPATRNRYMVSGVLFVIGAIGFELLQGRHDELHGVENMTYRIMVACEEGLELIATVMFVSASLRYLATFSGPVRLEVDPDS